jgi:hypothetical protein
MPLVSHWQVGATIVTDMWVRMAYLQFSRIIMACFKLSLNKMSEKIYSCYLSWFKVLPMKLKEISIISIRKHDRIRFSNDFRILEKQTSKNYKICQYLMISYVEVVVKNWVSQFYHVQCLQTKTSTKKNESWERCGEVWEWKWWPNLVLTYIFLYTQ